MRSIKIFFLLVLLFGNFDIISPPGKDIEHLYSALIRACRTNIRFAGPTSYLSPPSAAGNALGLLLLLLLSTGVKVRKKFANGSRIARSWPKHVLIMDSYTAAAALTFAFDDTCAYQNSLRSMVKSPTAAVLHVSQDSLQCYWVFAIPTVVSVIRTCTVRLQRLCKLATPSASSTLRLLTALQWLLIVAGDVELNPGPIPADCPSIETEAGRCTQYQGITELLPTVDASVLTEDDAFYVLEEVGSLAGRWRSMCLALGLKLSDAKTIASTCRDNPKECLRTMLEKWLNRSYNTQKHGLPTWRKLVGAVANNNGGDNPALAETIAKNHKCTDPQGQPAAIDPGAQLDPRAQSKGGGEGGTHSGYGGGDGSGGSNGGVGSGGTGTDPPTGTDSCAQPTCTDEHAPTTSANPHAQPANAIDLYAKYLRGKYETGMTKSLSLQWPPPPTRKVLKLAMILEENVRYGSSDEIIRHTQHGRINDVLYTKKSVKLEEIFELDTAKRKVILIEGAPGSGKSTLSWHICKQWQSKDLFQEFHTVVFVQLRDPAIHSATTVEQILPATKRIQTTAVVAELQAVGGRGMLWVLDGWDELPLHLRTDSIFHQLIEDPEELGLNSSTILITSRPVASGDLYHSITSRIEILGFTPAEVKEYFTEALKGNVRSVEILQNYLKEQPVIEASCYIPLNAAIVTHLFKAQNQRLPTTLHGIFTLLVIGCLIRHMKKTNRECRISSLDGLPSCLKEPFHNICALAYHHVMKNKATFSAEDLEQLGLPQELETLGLIQGVESFTFLQKSVSYNFLHLSVQELLASFYISKLPESEEIEIFKVLFGQPRFAAVFQFYAAFTKLKTAGIREIVANIVKKQEKPQLLYLIHGLYEARDVTLCQFVTSQLSGQIDLSRNSLSPLDCLSIGYFLCCVCHSTEGKFVVNLRLCSLDYNRVRFLVKEFSKSSDAMETTGAGVPSCTELHLNLAANDVGDDGAALLCAALNGNHSLKALDLTINNIGKAGITAIGDLLKQNKTLEHLDLRSNAVGDEIAALCAALKVNSSLKTLSLNYNGISDAGARGLSEALKFNQSLRELNLINNRISDEGAKALCAALRVNHSLTKLWLNFNNGISTEVKASMRKEFPGRVSI